MGVSDFLKKYNDLVQVYIAQAIRIFGLGLVNIFVPIYLLSLGYSFTMAMLYGAIYFASMALGAPLSSISNHRIGVKKTALLSAPFTIISLFLLSVIQHGNVHPFIPAFFGGLGAVFHWMPMHILFGRNTSERNQGASVGVLYASIQAVQASAPVIGGWLAVHYGFPILFIASLVVVTTASWPLFITKEYYTETSFRFEDFKTLGGGRFVWLTIVEGVCFNVTAYFLPVFIFLTLSDVWIVGSLKSAELVIFTLGSMCLGIYLDKNRSLPPMLIGSIILAGSLMFLNKTLSAKSLVLLVLSISIGWTIFFTTYETYLYVRARKSKNNQFFIARELLLNASRVTSFVFAAFMPLRVTFVVTAIFMLTLFVFPPVLE